MIKSKIETLLWRLGILNDEYIFLRNINSMKELSENECSNIWNVKNVHGDMNIKAFNNYFSRINKD